MEKKENGDDPGNSLQLKFAFLKQETIVDTVMGTVPTELRLCKAHTKKHNNAVSSEVHCHALQ